MLHELEDIENKLLQLEVRSRSNGSSVTLPDVSEHMGYVLELNKLNLLHVHDRQTFKALLTTLKEKAPLMYISFSSEPSPIFLEKLIAWLKARSPPERAGKHWPTASNWSWLCGAYHQ